MSALESINELRYRLDLPADERVSVSKIASVGMEGKQLDLLSHILGRRFKGNRNTYLGTLVEKTFFLGMEFNPCPPFISIAYFLMAQDLRVHPSEDKSTIKGYKDELVGLCNRLKYSLSNLAPILKQQAEKFVDTSSYSDMLVYPADIESLGKRAALGAAHLVTILKMTTPGFLGLTVKSQEIVSRGVEGIGRVLGYTDFICAHDLLELKTTSSYSYSNDLKSFLNKEGKYVLFQTGLYQSCLPDIKEVHIAVMQVRAKKGYSDIKLTKREELHGITFKLFSGIGSTGKLGVVSRVITFKPNNTYIQELLERRFKLFIEVIAIYDKMLAGFKSKREINNFLDKLLIL